MKLCSFAAVLLCAVTGSTLNPQGSFGQDERNLPQESRSSQGERPRYRRMRTFHIEDVHAGFLIVDGKFIDGPYKIEWLENQLHINGIPIEVPSRKLGPRDVEAVLSANNFLVIQGDQYKETDGSDDPGMALLRYFSGEDPNPKHLDTFKDLYARLDPPATPAGRLAGILPLSPESQKRVLARLRKLEEAELQNSAANLAVSRLNRFAYPLTTLGMLLTVIAFGHLISYRPNEMTATSSVNNSPVALRMVIRSVVFVVLLSGLDLLWTIMASQAGQMKELNPLASNLIHDPNQLIVFKAITTVAGTGILLGLRQYRTAQTASWWMCLVCTVLTFRWLTFNSMMIG